MSHKYAGEDALAYQEGHADQGGSVNYVQKRLQKRKGIEVVFDPKSHREFLTGFRQRKQKRRKEAAKQIEKKERQAKLQERAERRKALREKLKLDEYETDSDKPNTSRQAPQEDEAKPNQISTHTLGDYTSVVTVEPLVLGDDSDDGAASPNVSISDDSYAASQPASKPLHKALPAQRLGAKVAPQSKKMKPSAVYRKKKKHEGANSKKGKKKRQRG